MTYRETLAYIFGLARFGIKPGLERIRALLAALGDPQGKIRVVSIAGTNGKGSTASFLAAILAASGHRTGLFTSPHLISFTERIRINGVEISEDSVVELAESVLAVAPPRTTFFEVVTAMAFLHFARMGVDVAVMEAGMGGANDATNVADPLLSMITPISLDHCEYLGSTLEAIACEKVGIVRPGRPVICASQEPEAFAVIEKACADAHCFLAVQRRDFSALWEDAGLSYRGLHMELSGLKPGISGRYQAGNAASALAASEILAGMGFAVTPQSCREGTAQASWPGRMELFPGEPRILLDGAHNPAGGRALAASLGEVPRKRLILVAGVMCDKDAMAILEHLLPLADRVFAVAPSLERAMPAAELAGLVMGRNGKCVVAGGVAVGLRRAIAEAGVADLVLVCGSLFTVGEARAWLLNRKYEAIRG